MNFEDRAVHPAAAASIPEYQLRPAKSRDAAFIYDLRVLTMKDYISTLPGWSPERQEAFYMDFDPRLHQMVVVDGSVVGAISIIEKPDEFYFANMHFVPGMQKKGLGTALMREFIARAHQQRLPLTAQVLKTNRISIGMCERVGMEKYGETEDRYLLIARPLRPVAGESSK